MRTKQVTTFVVLLTSALTSVGTAPYWQSFQGVPNGQGLSNRNGFASALVTSDSSNVQWFVYGGKSTASGTTAPSGALWMLNIGNGSSNSWIDLTYSFSPSSYRVVLYSMASASLIDSNGVTWMICHGGLLSTNAFNPDVFIMKLGKSSANVLINFKLHHKLSG